MPANATLEQVTHYTEQVGEVFASTPEYQHSFQISFASGGFGGMLLKPWDERERTIFPIEGEVNAKLAGITGLRAPVFLPSALPSAGFFPVEFVIASTAPHEELLRFAEQIVQEAAASGQFAFPPITDVRIDQANARIAIDREKVAAMGLTMQQVGADVAAMVGGNFVNRFDLDGRAYKVIPQVERMARLTPDQLTKIHITGPGGTLMPLSAIATLQEGVEPRTLNRFQQLNSVKLSGIAIQSLDGGLKALEDIATRILPPGYRIDYTGESRQLRQEGGKFLGVDDDAQHLLAGRARHARRARREERDPDRRVREHEAARGHGEARGGRARRVDAPAAGLDDDGRDGGRALPADAGDGRGRGRAQLDRARARRRDDDRDLVHAVRGAFRLCADREGSPARARAGRGLIFPVRHVPGRPSGRVT